MELTIKINLDKIKPKEPNYYQTKLSNIEEIRERIVLEMRKKEELTGVNFSDYLEKVTTVE